MGLEIGALGQVNWNKPAEKKEIIIYCVLILALFLAFWRMALNSTSTDIENLQREFNDVELQVSTTKDFIEVLREAPKKVYKRLELKGDSPKLMALREAETTSPEVGFARAIKLLTEPSMMKGITLNGLEILETVYQEGYQIVPFNLVVTGSYIEISRFIERIEHAPVLVRVAYVTMNVDSGQALPDLSAVLQSELFLLM